MRATLKYLATACKSAGVVPHFLVLLPDLAPHVGLLVEPPLAEGAGIVHVFLLDS